MTWHYDRSEITALLSAEGFDIDLPESFQVRSAGASLTARRDRADRSILVAVDPGGRVRVTASTRIAESSRSVPIPDGPVLAAVSETTRQVTLTGRLERPGDVIAIIRMLGDDPPAAEDPERGSS